jgi:L-asparaginase
MNSSHTSLPRIAVLATGGTIAGEANDASKTSGYKAGVVGVEKLLGAVPSLSQVAQIQAEQVASIDSKDMTPALWATLCTRVNALLAQDDIDGPLNLLNAVTVTASRASWKQGVLVAFNNQIHCARDVTKTSTYAVDAFRSPEGGALGWVQDGQVEFQRSVVRPHTLHSPFQMPAELPAVEIVTSYAGASRAAIDAFVTTGVKGLVIAGTGNGSIHSTLQQAVADAVKQGVAVVRSSRVGAGHVMRNGAAPDDALGSITAGALNPYKARVLLMLALAAGTASADLQRVFDTY